MQNSPRLLLPYRRKCITQRVRIGGSHGKQSVHYTIGLYEDGTPGELFVEVSKAGAALRDWAGQAAMMLSIAIQHGTPLLTALNPFIGSKSEPYGEVEGHQYIKRCSSIMDLIARDIAITFLQRIDLADITSEEKIDTRSVENVG